MIAVDSSSFIAYFQGDEGDDTQKIERALDRHELVFPPAAFAEMLSDPKLTADFKSTLENITLLHADDGFWKRVGILRKMILKHRLKSMMGDALIAQSCIDYSVPLITRDSDFRHYAKYGGLKLA